MPWRLTHGKCNAVGSATSCFPRKKKKEKKQRARTSPNRACSRTWTALWDCSSLNVRPCLNSDYLTSDIEDTQRCHLATLSTLKDVHLNFQNKDVNLKVQQLLQKTRLFSFRPTGCQDPPLKRRGKGARSGKPHRKMNPGHRKMNPNHREQVFTVGST